MKAQWRCFPLHPEVPGEGMLLAQLFNRSEMEIEQWAKNFQQRASQLGLPFGSWKKIYNTRLAQELGYWAEEQGKGKEFHMAAFKGYLVEQQNLADRDILQKIAESIGLNRAEAYKNLEARSFKEAVDTDWVRARELEINSVPTLIMNGERLVGAQPYEQIVQFVSNNQDIK